MKRPLCACVTSQINSWSSKPKSRGVSSIVFTLGVCVYNNSVNYENSLFDIAPSKHVARVVVAIKTEALEGSSSLDEFETNVIENVAAVRIFVTKVEKPMAKLSTVQEPDKQLLFELVRAIWR